MGSLLIDCAFQRSRNTYAATDSALEIGFAPTESETHTPLAVWTGDLSFTSGGSSFTFGGSIEALGQSSATVAIAQTGPTETFAVEAPTSTGVGIGGGGAAAVGVVGAYLTPNSIAPIDPFGGHTADYYATRSVLAPYGATTMQDRPIALQLMTTTEFRLVEEQASLPAVLAGTP